MHMCSTCAAVYARVNKGERESCRQPHRQLPVQMHLLVSVPHSSVVHGQHSSREFLFRQALVASQLIMAADPSLGVPVGLGVVLALHLQGYQVDLVCLQCNRPGIG